MRPPRRMVTPIVFSLHALDRYIERARPSLELGFAKSELNNAVQRGEIDDKPPWWMRDRRKAVSYFCPEPNVCFPLRFDAGVFVATTCLTRKACEGAWH